MLSRPGREMTRRGFWVLAGANFAIALGYGAMLPLLPTLLASFADVVTPAKMAWHTGGLLGTYMLGLFLAAPLWGALSDRIGGRRLLPMGLSAYAAALVAFALADSLAGAYGWRVLAGVAGGAVLPVVNTAIGSEPDQRVRARLFAGASVATLLGLLAGPAMSGLVYAAMARMGDVTTMTRSVIGLPLASAAAFALAAAGVALGSIGVEAADDVTANRRATPVVWRQASPALFASFLVLLGLGAFEAMLSALAPGALSLTPPALGALFALCMVVMLAVQAGLFLVPILHRIAHGPILAAGFLVVATGIAVLAQAGSLADAAMAIALIGAGGAFLQPAIAYLATLNDAGASGTLLGALTGAGSLGQGLGSIAGGALVAEFDANGLWVVAIALAAGAAWIGMVTPGSTSRRERSRSNR